MSSFSTRTSGIPNQENRAPKRNLPDDVTLGPLSEQVYDLLAQHTSFPWPVMHAQSKRLGLDASALAHDDLYVLIAPVAEAVGRFTSPEREETVAEELRKLLDAGGARHTQEMEQMGN